MKLDVKNIRLTEVQLPLLLIGLTEEAKEKGANLKLTGAMKKMAQTIIGLGGFKATRGARALTTTLSLRGSRRPREAVERGFGGCPSGTFTTSS